MTTILRINKDTTIFLAMIGLQIPQRDRSVNDCFPRKNLVCVPEYFLFTVFYSVFSSTDSSFDTKMRLFLALFCKSRSLMKEEICDYKLRIENKIMTRILILKSSSVLPLIFTFSREKLEELAPWISFAV